MNRFELWDKVARNSQCRFPQPFRLVVALRLQQHFYKCPVYTIAKNNI